MSSGHDICADGYAALRESNQVGRKMLACRLPESWDTRARSAFEKSGVETMSEWVGSLVKSEVVRLEAGKASREGENGHLPPEIRLVAAETEIKGLQALVASHRERITEAQTHALDLKSENDRLHHHLEEAHANVERVTLMLPAPREEGESGGWRWWPFGKVRSSFGS